MSLLVAAPILLSLTLLVSGLAKLGARQGTEDAMTSLRLPLRSLHPSVATVLPVAEIVLALVLWVPAVELQVIIALVITLLMLSYLVIIARALSWEETVECSCFGTLASPTVSSTTLARNVLLTALGVVGILAAATGRMTQALVQTPLALVALGFALVVAVVLTALAIGTARPADAASTAGPAPRAAGAAGATYGAADDDMADDAGQEHPDDEALDYEREAIPAGVLQRPGGELVTLRQLTAQQAALLVFVSEGCGPCERVLDEVPGWIEALSPYMQIRPVLSRPLDQLRERTAARVGEHVLHDPQFSARESLGSRGAPSAVLLGADGLLAGGPVTGGGQVIEFVEEIREQLQIAQDEGELPAATR